MTPSCPMTSSSRVLSYKLFIPSSSLSFNAPIKQVWLFSDTYLGELECHRNISLYPNQLIVQWYGYHIGLRRSGQIVRDEGYTRETWALELGNGTTPGGEPA